MINKFGFALPTIRPAIDPTALTQLPATSIKGFLDNSCLMRIGHTTQDLDANVYLLTPGNESKTRPLNYKTNFDPARHHRPPVYLGVMPNTGVLKPDSQQPFVVQMQPQKPSLSHELSYGVYLNSDTTSDLQLLFDLALREIWYPAQSVALAQKKSETRTSVVAAKSLYLDFVQNPEQRQQLIDSFMLAGGAIYLSTKNELLHELQTTPSLSDLEKKRLHNLERVAYFYHLSIGPYQGEISSPAGERIGLYKNGVYQFGLESMQETPGLDFENDPNWREKANMTFSAEDLSYAISKYLSERDQWPYIERSMEK